MTFTDAHLYHLVILGGELAYENVPKTDKTFRNISIYLYFTNPYKICIYSLDMSGHRLDNQLSITYKALKINSKTMCPKKF